jgi:preprotein translocase subunit SecF
MSNNIEDFIKQHRDQFDDQRPDRSLWLEIERNLNTTDAKEKVFRISFLKIAASVVFILSVGVLIGIKMTSPTNELNYAISPEMKQYKETEAYYRTQVKLKLNELKDPVVKSNVENDLKQLDEIYNQLKTEMMNTEYTNSNMMIDAMIKNHKTKVEILESILNKQNQIKNESEIISL